MIWQNGRLARRRSSLKIPVLTYHAINVEGTGYSLNDHVALQSDLQSLTRLGWRVEPLDDVVDWAAGGRSLPDRTLALTFDDGSWFDYYDLDHPSHGRQRSFFNILRDFADQDHDNTQPRLNATSFVIASPEARTELDAKGLIGQGWWGDEWWPLAETSGLLSIGCHSWDHVHPDLDRVAQREQLKGDFSRVDCLADCAVQFEQATTLIASRLNGRRPTLFAYPYGQTNAFQVGEYLPGNQARHGFKAAFTTDPEPVEKGMNPWALPRLVCGRDWRSAEEFAALLQRYA
jgi:peptidoglycan/xylan/chitin deacetylase (PgdA/CDA1 family)